MKTKVFTQTIPTNKDADGRLSWELLAKIAKCSVDEYKEMHNKKFGRYSFDCRPFAEMCKCPFGERDLMHDTCYIGSNEHKCKYFERYDDENGKSFVWCNHPPKMQAVQLSLNFD